MASATRSDSLPLWLGVQASKLQAYWHQVSNCNERNRVQRLVLLKEVGRPFKSLLQSQPYHHSILGRVLGSFPSAVWLLPLEWVRLDIRPSYPMYTQLWHWTSSAQKEGRSRRALMLRLGKCYESKNSLSIFLFHVDLAIFGYTPWKLSWKVYCRHFMVYVLFFNCLGKLVRELYHRTSSLKLEPAQPGGRTVLKLELGVLKYFPDFWIYWWVSESLGRRDAFRFSFLGLLFLNRYLILFFLQWEKESWGWYSWTKKEGPSSPPPAQAHHSLIPEY